MTKKPATTKKEPAASPASLVPNTNDLLMAELPASEKACVKMLYDGFDGLTKATLLCYWYAGKVLDHLSQKGKITQIAADFAERYEFKDKTYPFKFLKLYREIQDPNVVVMMADKRIKWTPVREAMKSLTEAEMQEVIVKIVNDDIKDQADFKAAVMALQTEPAPPPPSEENGGLSVDAGVDTSPQVTHPLVARAEKLGDALREQADDYTKWANKFQQRKEVIDEILRNYEELREDASSEAEDTLLLMETTTSRMVDLSDAVTADVLSLLETMQNIVLKTGIGSGDFHTILTQGTNLFIGHGGRIDTRKTGGVMSLVYTPLTAESAGVGD